MDSSKNYMKSWVSIYEGHRPFLLSFAYRLTGSMSEAEDLVQDTFLNCLYQNPSELSSPTSWLTKVCSNRAIDYLRLAYKRREAYPGVWLPDTIPDDLHFWGDFQHHASPEKNILFTESLTTSFLLLLQSLNPKERVVYLLREVFGHSFKEIAGYLDQSEESCRKIFQRAKKAKELQKATYSFEPEEAKKLIHDFYESARKGDVTSLLRMLDDNVEFWSDGGGKVSAAGRVLRIKKQIANFYKTIYQDQDVNGLGYKYEFRFLNFRPGLILFKMDENENWNIDSLVSFEISNNQIMRIYSQRNPDKILPIYNKIS